MTDPIRIAIIGGGISGLSTAYYIHRKVKTGDSSVQCMVLEAGARPGGKIITTNIDGRIIEGGPESFVTRKPWAMQLCHELGLQNRLISADDAGRNFVLHGGQLQRVPATPQGFASTPLLSLRGKLRAAQELVASRRASTSDESLGHFVRRRFGDEVLENLVAPAIGSIYLSDVDQLSTRVSFERFLQLEQSHGSVLKGMLAMQRAAKSKHKAVAVSKPPSFLSFKNGLSELVDALAAQLRRDNTEVLLNAQVMRIDKTDAGYHVHLEDGRAITADIVVMAVPAFAMAALIAPHDAEAAGQLKAVRYVDVATIALAYPAPSVHRQFDGFGIVMPASESSSILACEVISNKWPQRDSHDEVLLRVFVGGHRNEAFVAQTDDMLIKLAHEELSRLFKIDATPAMARVTRWQPGNPQYPVGYLDTLSKIEASLKTTMPHIFLTGAAMRGLGIPDCVRQAGDTADQVLSEMVNMAHTRSMDAQIA